MRKLIILIVALLLAVPTGAAFASEEQLIYEQIGNGYYATWQGTSGSWDNGNPGSNQKAVFTYTFPEEQLQKYELTRVEANSFYSIDPQVYNSIGGWQGHSYSDYYREFLIHAPNNLKLTKTSENLDAGEVDVLWNFTLNPTLLPEGERQAMDTKDPENRHKMSFLASGLFTEQTGWLWILPVHIKWYGIPNSTELDLAVTNLSSGVPSGEKAKPGQQYTGTVVYENLSLATSAKPAIVKVTHNGYDATLTDESGNVITSLNLAPGEKKTLQFKWHGVQTKQSELKATINLPPDPALQEPNYTNNEKTVIVPIDLQNLKVQLLTYTPKAQRGSPVSVSARIFNESGEMVLTRLIVKINGKIVRDTKGYDVISQEDVAVNFTMPDTKTTVEIIVNPDKDRPDNEITYADNSASCTIALEQLPPPPGSGKYEVKINAPNRVPPFKSWNFSVDVSGWVPPAASPDAPPVTITVNVTGKSENMEYRLSGGSWGDPVITNRWPVNFSQKRNFDIKRDLDNWKHFSKELRFTFPSSSGFPGQDIKIPLNAQAYWGDSYKTAEYKGADSANVLMFREKMDPSLRLTQ